MESRRSGTSNLISLADRTPEERRAIASKGGKASVEEKRRRRTLREELEILMSAGDRQERISVALVDAAEAGNVSAFNAIRDTLGEKPKTEVSADLGLPYFATIDDMTPEQVEIAKAYFMSDTPIGNAINKTLGIEARKEILEDLLP